MYKNSHQRSINNPLSSIRLNAIPLDKKAAFVESVCTVLIESRFGPGRTCQLFVNLSDRPELEPAVFYDLTDEGMVPCYAISPLGRAGYQVVEAEFRKQNRWASSAPVPLATQPTRHRQPWDAAHLRRDRRRPRPQAFRFGTLTNAVIMHVEK